VGKAGIMTHELNLKPVRPTVEIMKMLENKGLIYRLCPGHDIDNPPPGGCAVRDIYVSDSRFGPHKIIAVTINRQEFSAFGTHSENEEFLLIGNASVKPLYLLIALMDKKILAKKIEENTLTPDDFLLLDCIFNDPELSFFIMKKDVPHGEATTEGGDALPSFYVTEGRDLDLIPIDFKNYRLVF
jgi:hypothetical protein